VPDLVVQSDDGSGGRSLQFVQADGTVQATVTESSGLVMADVGGGILLSDAARLRRWPTVPGERPWQRTARGATSSHAQGPDGTVWFTEAASFAGDEAAVWLVGVDGMTGADRVRLALPTSTETTEHYEPCSASGATRSLVPARVSAPVVDANGDVLVLVETSDTTTRPGCELAPAHSEDAADALQVLRVGPTGTATWTSVATVTATRDAAGQWSGSELGLLDGGLLPDSNGGVVVTFEQRPAGEAAWERQRTYVDAEGVRGDVVPTAVTPTVAGEDGVVYGSESTGVVAASNAATGTVIWTSAEPAQIVAALAEGAVAIKDGGALRFLDTGGQSSGEGGFPLAGTGHIFGGLWVGATDGSLSARLGAVLDRATYSFLEAEGNAYAQRAPWRSQFTSPRDAAVWVLNEYNWDSVERNREVAGHICSSGVHYTPGPATWELHYSDLSSPRPCPDGTVRVATWHTHNRYGDLGFSGNDAAYFNSPTRLDMREHYLSNYCGWVVRWNMETNTQEALQERVRSPRSGEPQCNPY